MPLPDALFDWLLRWSDVIGMVGSLVLSALLVYFYWGMRNVQRTQTEIQSEQKALLETQTEINRANHEPKLRIVDVSFGKRDKITVELGYIGNGIATELALVCVLETENDYFDIQPLVTPLTEFGDSPGDQNRSLTPDSNGDFSANVLIPLESSGRFRSTLSWFTAATSKLHYTGTKSADVHVYVQYRNLLGDVRKESLASASVWLVGGKSVEEALTEYMDGMARNLPAKTDSSELRSRHILQREPFPGAERVSIDYSMLDMVIEYKLDLHIDTPPEVSCEVERGRTVVATVAESSEETIVFDGNEQDRLEHGELIHVFAVNGNQRWQIDMIGAGDYPPEGPPHAETIQRMMKLR